MANTPILFNAQQILNAAYTDIGVLGQANRLQSYLAQDGLFRLNSLISQLRLQEFSCPFIARMVFPTVANQSAYTIGPGGDFDTARPTQIEGAGLLLTPSIASFTITGASQSAGTFTVAGDQTGSLPSGSTFVVTGSTGNNNSYQIIEAVYGTSTTITVATAIPDATVDGSIQVFGESSAVTEIPISVITDRALQANRVKTLPNSQWTQCYYNPTDGNGRGTIWLWPTPNTAVNGCVLYLEQPVGGFADLTTAYAFPPGYAEVFEYGLALRLLAPFGVSDQLVRADMQLQYASAIAMVKRQNLRLDDMLNDTSSIKGAGSLYNILVGNG